MPLPDHPRARARGTSPPSPMSPTPIAAPPESPPGALAASRLLGFLAAPTLVALVLFPLHLEAEVVLADPVLLLAVLLSAGTALLLTWNLVCTVAAHLATATILPVGVARPLARFVQRVGTRQARQVLTRHGAVAALGTGIVLSVGPVAVAAPLAAQVSATVGARVTRDAPLATLPDAARGPAPTATGAGPVQDPVPLPPDDLTWGAPRVPGTRAGTPSPESTPTQAGSASGASTPIDASSPEVPGSASDTTPTAASTTDATAPADRSGHGGAGTAPTAGAEPREQTHSGTGRILTRSPERRRGGEGTTDPVLARLQASTGPEAHGASPGTGVRVDGTSTHTSMSEGAGTDTATDTDAGAATDTDAGAATGTGTGSRATGVLHVVTPGDNLWAIAARHLGPDAGNEQIAALWPRIHAANAELIGADPGLIHPGTQLRIPGIQP